MTARENTIKAVSTLQNVADSIRRLEADAREALFTRDDTEAHRHRLEEKTMLLMELPEAVEPFLGGMEREARAEIKAGAENFARRAAQAWELSSLFYMAALLVPDDYEEGQRNDLERFIDRLREKYLA